MEIADLYEKLKIAYTAENMNLISGRIIHMFQEHQYDSLRAIQKVVNEYTPCAEEKINKVFSRLIMFYHPDRLSQSLVQLEKAFKAGDFEHLFSMSHILNVQNLEPSQLTLSSIISDEDLAEEFGWDGGDDGYSYFINEEEDPDLDEEIEFTSSSFLMALKRRVYGNLNADFPLYLLEDLEEIDMADYELDSLDGIEACRYVKVVDLANNHIGIIEALSNLIVLQVLDISFNDVDDLSPLFELSHLNYLNVMGNRVHSWQLEQLHLKGVTIIE
ncbi:MAG: hypothetical protein QNK35_01565 [Bacteroides sp.]|nr:hypothetical protein [Bacteroides sp.]